MMSHDPMNESLADDTEEPPEDELVVRLDVPDGVRLVLIINGVVVDLDD